MDPVTMAAIGSALGGLGGLGGGGTKVSQSLTNNASTIVNAIVQGSGTSPSTGAVSNPQTASPVATSSGAETVPNYSSAALGGTDSYDGADLTMPTATGYTSSQSTLYVIGAIVIAGLAAFFFWKK